MWVSRASRAFHGAELALPDQAFAKVRKQRQIVGAKEAGESQLRRCGLAFHWSFNAKREVCVWSCCRGSTVSFKLHAKSNWNQVPLMGVAIIASAKQRDFMIAWIKDAQPIPLVLLPMLEPPQQTVAVVGLKRQPLLLCRIRRAQAQRPDQYRDSRRSG